MTEYGTMSTSTLRDLLVAVREHSGMELASIREAGDHGADAGWPGFTSYTDTVAFYDKNEDLIWSQLEDDADAMGNANVLEFIGSFGGAQHVSDLTTFKNLLAWYALEQAGRYSTDHRDNR